MILFKWVKVAEGLKSQNNSQLAVTGKKLISTSSDWVLTAYCNFSLSEPGLEDS